MMLDNQLSHEFDYVEELMNLQQDVPCTYETDQYFSRDEIEEQSQPQQYCYFSPFQQPYYPHKTYHHQSKIKVQYSQMKRSQNLPPKTLQKSKQQYILPKIQINSNEQIKNNKQYPTKNFLPSFRSSFLNYLSLHFNSSQFCQIEIVKRIKNKDSINLGDYQDLFKTDIFRPLLKSYFKDRIIYRDLLQSRIEYKTKRNYFKKISVFEKAFKRGIFKKIN